METKKRSRLLKWSLLFLQWIPDIPRYLRHWGLRKGIRSLTKIALSHGLAGLREELSLVRGIVESRKLVDGDIDYLIAAPSFTDSSAGIRCLYRLGNDLSAAGYKVAIWGSSKCPCDTPLRLLSLGEARRQARKGAWVIYPETIEGNPLGGPNVVRWVLNRPGLLGGDEVYASHEQVFVYSDVYVPYVKNPIIGKIYIPTIDQNLFYPPKSPDLDNLRSLECFYVGKSKLKEGHFNPNETFEIKRSSPDRDELGKLFRASRVLYCFDNSTALIYEAILCGCPVVVIPDGTQTWADYQTLELGTTGIYWGKAPDKLAPVDPREFIERLKSLESEYHQQLQALIRHTQGLAQSASHCLGLQETTANV